MGKVRAVKGAGKKRMGKKRAERRRKRKAAAAKHGILNTQPADATGKNIFKDPDMRAQFINDHVHVPYLEGVSPEEIENVSARFTPMFETEREADTVLRIRKRSWEKSEFFVVALIEHKSSVEYNIYMQIFRYMVYIWDDYAREMEQKQTGITKLKDFKYPPVIPVVYYEGKGEWTAPRRFYEKIIGGEKLKQYIPDFDYYMVNVCGYSKEDLLAKEDPLAFIMLIQQMQDAAGVHDFMHIPEEKLTKMVADAKESTMLLIRDILLVSLLYMNIPTEEAQDIVSKVKEKKMGVLFANAEKMDIQLERRRTKEALEELDRERKRSEKVRVDLVKEVERVRKANERASMEAERAMKADERATKEAENAEKMLRLLIVNIQESGRDKAHAMKTLQEEMLMSKEDAEEKITLYWKKPVS